VVKREIRKRYAERTEMMLYLEILRRTERVFIRCHHIGDELREPHAGKKDAVIDHQQAGTTFGPAHFKQIGKGEFVHAEISPEIENFDIGVE